MRNISFLCLFIGFTLSLSAQLVFDTAEEAEKQYEQNIKQTHLEGVYIPASIDEAIQEIKKLSTEEDLKKFAEAPIDDVAERLQAGLGRWMIVNWQFYSGSRLSHLIKSKGVMTPDGMAQYLIRYLHADLNNISPNEEAIIKKVNANHEAEMKKSRKNDKLIKKEIRKIKDPDQD